MKGVDLLVIQPTPFCNINCSYCYLPDRSNTNKISAEIVARTIDSLIREQLIGDKLSIAWHAGEPLVLPPSFYIPLFELIASRLNTTDIPVQHCMQTNGTLISQEWCDCIISHQIKIGVSIDGPEHIHDAKRKTRSGKGTFIKVMEGIRQLQLNNIPYHAIAVVTEQSLADPDSFFDFFYHNGFFQLGLNIEEVEGSHTRSSVFADGMTEKVKAFYTHLFHRYMNSDKRMRIREFDRCMEAILRNPETPDITNLQSETHQNTPMAIISVDHQGNFSTFSPELIGQTAPDFNNFILGNILESGFLHAKGASLLNLLTMEINKGIKKCKKECDFFHVCGGGAPANKYFENGTFNSSETKYCNYNIKMPTELVLAYLEEQLSLA
jgi:uncharacterized protein